MRAIGIVAVAALAAVAGGCASDPYYARNNAYYSPGYGYAYQSPSYAYAPPGYYRNTTYYTYPAPPPSSARTYDGYWDYQRNYRGISSSPELSRM